MAVISTSSTGTLGIRFLPGRADRVARFERGRSGTRQISRTFTAAPSGTACSAGQLTPAVAEIANRCDVELIATVTAISRVADAHAIHQQLNVENRLGKSLGRHVYHHDRIVGIRCVDTP